MAGTVKRMMARTILHGIGTLVAAFAAFHFAHEMPMATRMMVYAAIWIAVAAAYLMFLMGYDHLSLAFDRHIREVVREERVRDELLSYQRRLRAPGPRDDE